jgi:hypothetical protein
LTKEQKLYLGIPLLELFVHVASDQQGARLSEQLPPGPVLELEVRTDVVLDDARGDALLTRLAEVLAFDPPARGGLDHLDDLTDPPLADFLHVILVSKSQIMGEPKCTPGRERRKRNKKKEKQRGERGKLEAAENCGERGGEEREK